MSDANDLVQEALHRGFKRARFNLLDYPANELTDEELALALAYELQPESKPANAEGPVEPEAAEPEVSE